MVRRTLFSTDGDKYADIYSHFKVVAASGNVGGNSAARVTWTGSMNLTNNGVGFDEVWMRVASASVFAAFRDNWNYINKRKASSTYAPSRSRSVVADRSPRRVPAGWSSPPSRWWCSRRRTRRRTACRPTESPTRRRDRPGDLAGPAALHPCTAGVIQAEFFTWCRLRLRNPHRSAWIRGEWGGKRIGPTRSPQGVVAVYECWFRSVGAVLVAVLVSVALVVSGALAAPTGAVATRSGWTSTPPTAPTPRAPERAPGSRRARPRRHPGGTSTRRARADSSGQATRHQRAAAGARRRRDDRHGHQSTTVPTTTTTIPTPTTPPPPPVPNL